MNVKLKLEKLGTEIAELRVRLQAIGPLHPGSVSLQYQVCGNPKCRCARADNPERHGPYPKLVYVYRGRQVCRFVRMDCVERIKARLAAYKEFRKLMDRWIALSIKAAQIEFFDRPPSEKFRKVRLLKSSPLKEKD